MAYTSKAVTVTGTLVDLNGTLLNGEIQVTLWDNVNFFDFDNKLHVFPEMVETYTVTNGIVSFIVESSDNCIPAGINYNIVFKNNATSQTVLLYRGPLDYQATPINLDDIIDASAIALITSPSLVADLINRVEALEAGGGVTVNASEVVYSNPTYPTVEMALNSLLYTPLTITGFTTGVSTQEIGATVIQENLSWGITLGSRGLISSQSLRTPQALDIGLATSDRNYTHYQTYNPSSEASYTYTLFANDGVQLVSSTASLAFRWKRYWGTGPVGNSGWTWPTNPNDTEIKAFSQELATSYPKTLAYTSLNNQYIYYCYPNSWGSAPTFTYNGLIVTFDQTTRSFTNASGGTTTYRICRSPNPLNGDITIIVS